jgi:hypothetical protein
MTKESAFDYRQGEKIFLFSKMSRLAMGPLSEGYRGSLPTPSSSEDKNINIVPSPLVLNRLKLFSSPVARVT